MGSKKPQKVGKSKVVGGVSPMWRFGTLVLIPIALALLLKPFVISDQAAPILASGGSNDAGTESMTNSFVRLYRYGEFRFVPRNQYQPSNGVTLKDLVQVARELFEDDTIARFASHHGRPIHTLDEALALMDENTGSLDSFLVALDPRENFMWPALRVGDEVKVTVQDGTDGEGRQVKVKTLSLRPRVFEVMNFLSDDECEHMIERARSAQLVESAIGGDNSHGSKDSYVRNSHQTWIGPSQYNDDGVFEKVRRRTVDLTMTAYDTCEDTQVVRYNPMEHYFAHHDYTAKGDVPDNPYFGEGGNRLLTLIFYLNDVEGGGHTVFPYANSTLRPVPGKVWYEQDGRQVYYGVKGCEKGGLKVQPKKGRVLLFYSLHEAGTYLGEIDEMSLHAGCDVLGDDQTKWMANQWVRNRRVEVNGKMHLYDSAW